MKDRIVGAALVWLTFVAMSSSLKLSASSVYIASESNRNQKLAPDDPLKRRHVRGARLRRAGQHGLRNIEAAGAKAGFRPLR